MCKKDKKMNNQRLALNVTLCCVKVLPPLRAGGGDFNFLIRRISCDGNSLLMCFFNCGIFLKPLKNFIGINSQEKHYLNNFLLNSSGDLPTLDNRKR